nr:MAG TPA: hypothetical protein [Bacteriophage sp.]
MPGNFSLRSHSSPRKKLSPHNHNKTGHVRF